MMHLPKFWYSGSKKWGIASDLGFITERLKWLSYENQKIASEQYDDIFKFHINKGEVMLARKNANMMLNDFVKSLVLARLITRNSRLLTMIKRGLILKSSD